MQTQLRPSTEEIWVLICEVASRHDSKVMVQDVVKCGWVRYLAQAKGRVMPCWDCHQQQQEGCAHDSHQKAPPHQLSKGPDVHCTLLGLVQTLQQQQQS